ncbi:uncharacterized protein [Penaeus vannamei]|uniref:uncharacterized protein n=1 Tax=Penaeus vannamei TaxID=6689 RepID=UPI00387F9C7B
MILSASCLGHAIWISARRGVGRRMNFKGLHNSLKVSLLLNITFFQLETVQGRCLVLPTAVALHGASSLPTASLADVLARARHQEAPSSRRLQVLDPETLRKNITLAEEEKEETAVKAAKEEDEDEDHMEGLLEYLELSRPWTLRTRG